MYVILIFEVEKPIFKPQDEKDEDKNILYIKQLILIYG